MISLPFRLLATVAIALFFASKWVRRAVAAVGVSATMVALQKPDMLPMLSAGPSAQVSLLQALSALSGG